MAYTEADFKSCKYNPLIKNFKEQYASLFKIIPKEYTGDKEALLRYVCLMYDPKSPLIKDSASIETRKRKAAQCSGFELNEDELEFLFELKDPCVIEVIDIFLRKHINERLAYMIFANEQTFYEYGKRLLQPVTDGGNGEKGLLSSITIKTKLSEDMDAINARLENDIQKLYMGDAQLQKAVAKVKFTPEAFANKN
jgi:hypothetical protein